MMPYFYFGFAVVTLLACIYQAIMLNKYKNKYEYYKHCNICSIAVRLNGDDFEFKTGDKFYSATPRSDGTIEATKRTCDGVAIKNKKIYLMYSYLHWSDGYFVEYDSCGKTKEEAIENMRKKICCNKNVEDK